MKILLVDEDESLSKLVNRCLASHHHIVDTVTDGEAGWTYGSTFDYDLIMLDITLPKLDGISLCKRFRAEGYTTPILFLTAKDTSTAKVNGLDAGADDYVVKPFDLAELSARIRALLRRSRNNPLALLSWGDLLLNSSTCTVTYNGRPLILTTKEYELIELLLQDSRHVFSSDEILGRLWSSDEFPSDATVRSHVRRVRHKLVSAGAPSDFIATLHGRGYYLKAIDGTDDRPFAATIHQAHDPGDRQAEYLTFLKETWVREKPKMLAQLTGFAQAIAGLQMGSVDAQWHAQAQHTAQKLAATLSIFGLHRGMTLARQLEQTLSSQPHGQPHQTDSIKALTQQLQQELQHLDTIQSLPLTGMAQGLETPLIRCEAEAETKVMVVDTDQTYLRSLPQLLGQWGFKLTTLADPQQFWVVLQAVVPDVLVLDVNLSEVNGFELCQALRSDPQWQRLPIVFLSVLSDRVTQNQAFTVGADDYLCKPIVGIDLANRILNRLQRVRACTT